MALSRPVTSMSEGDRSRFENDGRSTAETTDDGARRHWIVIVSLLASFLVIPWTLIALSSVGFGSGSIGVPYRDAYLVLPLVPAVGLGLIAVWSAVTARRSD